MLYYDEVKTNKTKCISSYSKLKIKKKIKNKFMIIFATLLFANIISLALVLNEPLRTSVFVSFSNFANHQVNGIDDNLKSSKNIFKQMIELNIPINQNYILYENAIIVDIDSDYDIQSTFNCIVKEVAFINKYNVVISNDKFDFHYLNLDLTNLQVGELININQKVGVVKKGGKLYFYVTKDGKRLKLTIKNQKVMFSEN